MMDVEALGGTVHHQPLKLAYWIAPGARHDMG
jgi:hypothetical protein